MQLQEKRGSDEDQMMSLPGVLRRGMKQVLLNMLLNGIEAMPDGGVLSINGKVDNRMLHIEISDTGKGIPEEELPRIFDLYFTTKEMGTDLGLSIAQRIITEHGGWLDVDLMGYRYGIVEEETKTVYDKFIDEDGDGMHDTVARKHCFTGGDKNSVNDRFVDENGDGICDGRQFGMYRYRHRRGMMMGRSRHGRGMMRQ